MPVVAPITGISALCAGDTATFADTTTGGTWSVSSTVFATITAGGFVTALSGGTDTVFYTVTAACGSARASHILTVNPLPFAGSISGSSTLCMGGAVAFTNTAAGGVWSSSATGVATVSTTGMVYSVSAGTAIISYTVTNGCGSASATFTLLVNPAPDAGVVTGKDTMCVGDSYVFATTATAGTWSSLSPLVASVSATGTVTAMGVGFTSIRYTVINACGSNTSSHSLQVKSAADCMSGIAGQNKVADDLLIFPNPNGGSFHVMFTSATNSLMHMNVTNVLGQKVLSTTITTNQDTAVTLETASGVYLITVTDGAKTFARSVVVE
jgi:hypothetical protein